MNLKDLLKDNFVRFNEYWDGRLYYTISHQGETYKFPIPPEDMVGARFHATDKAIMFMRFIKKAMDSGEFAQQK